MKDIRVFRNSMGLLGLALLFLATGCSSKTAGISDYVKYMNDEKNGLVQVKEVDGLVFKVQWLTPELMALNEIKKTAIKKAEWDKTIKEYGGMRYCRLSVTGAKGQNVYAALKDDGLDENAVEAYLNFDGQQDVFLTSGADTAQCALYSFSKTYGLAKQLDIATGFEDMQHAPGSDYVLEWRAGFFDRGLLKFRIKDKDINNIPTLTI